MNFKDQLYQLGRAGSNAAQMQISVVKQIDKNRAVQEIVENPDTMHDMEKFPQEVHMSNTDQAMKLLDVV